MTVKRLLNGVGVAPGIVIGPARVIRWELPEVTRSVILPEQVEDEIDKLLEALAAVKELLEDLKSRTRQRAGEEESKIFDAQILMLEDPEFLGEVKTLIRTNQLSAARAFEFKTLEMQAQWQQSHSYYLRQRVADLTGIQIRVLNRLLGKSQAAELAGSHSSSAIVLTRELTPGLTVQLEREQVAGLASVEGAKTAHAAILARSLGIPCVMGLVDGLDKIDEGTTIILDGMHGVVLVDPTPAEIEEAKRNEGLRAQLQVRLEKVVGQPAETIDGERVTLRGNIDLPEEIDGTAEHGAEGVGLLRTEFLVLGRMSMPSEDEQARFFSLVARRFAPHPVVVRTYDLGGDKFPAAFRTDPESNPFLGWRAIRVCLDHPEFFRTQIRAALRARLEGDVRLMLPMVTQLEEVDCTRDFMVEAARALEREGVPAATTLPVGVMIETPAAAIQAGQFVAKSDFVSVGTNDLTQYTLAVDRGNARLAGRFLPHHPAILHLLAGVRRAAQAAGVEASICGEMASDPLSAFLLIGLGFRVLSVSPPTLPLIRWLVRQVDATVAARAAESALAASTATEAERVIEEAIAQYVDLELLRAGRLPTLVGPGRLKSFARGSA
jgi:phosphotransferase system enzyme I (PtsI)